MDYIGKRYLGKIFGVDVTLLACEHGKTDILLEWRDRTLIVERNK